MNIHKTDIRSVIYDTPVANWQQKPTYVSAAHIHTHVHKHTRTYPSPIRKIQIVHNTDQSPTPMLESIFGHDRYEE